MTDQNQPITHETPSTPAAPAAQPAAPVITPEIQAMIDAARVEGRNSGAAEVRRAMEARTRQPSATPSPQPSTPATPAPTPAASPAPEYQAMRAFDRAMRRFDLSDDALAVIEEDFARANPSDPAAWVTSRAAAYGWKQLGGSPALTAPAVSTPPAPPAPSAPPMPGSTPPASTASTADTPILSLLRADPSRVDALVQSLGPIKFRDRMMQEFRATGQRVRIR